MTSRPSILIDHPVIQSKLTELRDRRTPPERFRTLLEEISCLMAHDATYDWPTTDRPVETPLENIAGRALARPVTLVPILRAGLGMSSGILKLLPEASVGHIGLYRNEKTLDPFCYYQKLPPNIADTEVLLLDPMLATGGSASAAISSLRRAGVIGLRFICLLAAPEGIRRIQAEHPDVPIYCAAIDRQLDHRGYILPGLGDAGDRSFGT